MERSNYALQLNELLASYQLHYQNLRSLHWNIRGKKFFELHAKYEELYNRAQLVIDEIAERILAFGATPHSSFSEYISVSDIKENAVITDGTRGVEYILRAQERLLTLEKDLLEISEKMDDEGTNSLMSDLIREKEKSNWMFRSWLKQ